MDRRLVRLLFLFGVRYASKLEIAPERKVAGVKSAAKTARVSLSAFISAFRRSSARQGTTAAGKQKNAAITRSTKRLCD
jgi:hypothetical protein